MVQIDPRNFKEVELEAIEQEMQRRGGRENPHGSKMATNVFPDQNRNRRKKRLRVVLTLAVERVFLWTTSRRPV